MNIRSSYHAHYFVRAQSKIITNRVTISDSTTLAAYLSHTHTHTHTHTHYCAT